MPRRLLVDWCTYRPIGHTIEGLHHAHGYAAADPALEVSIVLNAQTTVELAECCPWLASVFTVELDVRGDTAMDRAFAGVPRDWDWVVQEPRRRHEYDVSNFGQLGRLAAAADAHYRSRCPGAPAYLSEQRLRLRLPEAAVAQAGTILQPGRLALAVMLGGGGPRSRYPSAATWALVLAELRRRWPDATLVILGKTPGPDGRRASVVANEEVLALAAEVGAFNGYDLPLLVQLALVKQSRLFLSPHTGFGFAALSVGTPWLVISGGPWFEYFHNGVAFHSLVPDTSRFPAYRGPEGSCLVMDEDGSGPRDASMTRARLLDALPELLDSAGVLIRDERRYEDCLAIYFASLLKALGGDAGKLNSWDQVHRRYV
jgi:hypothetical protein